MFEYYLNELLNSGIELEEAKRLAEFHYKKYQLHIGLAEIYANDPVDDINYAMGFSFAFEQIILHKKSFNEISKIVAASSQLDPQKIFDKRNHILGMQRGLWECEKLIDIISELQRIKQQLLEGKTPTFIVLDKEPKIFH